MTVFVRTKYFAIYEPIFQSDTEGRHTKKFFQLIRILNPTSAGFFYTENNVESYRRTTLKKNNNS